MTINAKKSSEDGDIKKRQANTECLPPLITPVPAGGKDETLNWPGGPDHPFHLLYRAPPSSICPEKLTAWITTCLYWRICRDDDGRRSCWNMPVYGDYKGIPKQQVRMCWPAAKMDRIDVQARYHPQKLIPNVVTIFLNAESEEELVRRLRERKKTEPEGQLVPHCHGPPATKRLQEFGLPW
ncbi:MAG: hypothetical protein H6641_12070 [Caldilineaceae bacterium]|nr:hypothetical protein [Caldilineaceae bacterium]